MHSTPVPRGPNELRDHISRTMGVAAPMAETICQEPATNTSNMKSWGHVSQDDVRLERNHVFG
jgi:hypothetical protein